MKEQIKPGFFGCVATADTRRIEFDIMNEQYLSSGKKADVVFFGDSITQHWDLNLYFNPEALKLNRGIGGDITLNASKRFDADVLQLDAPIVVILLGINDLLTTAPDLWHKKPGADCDEVIGGIEKNFRAMLSKCDDKKVYVCSVLPQSLCQPYDRKFFDNNIVRTNELLKDLCCQYGAEYVDYYSALSHNGELPEELSHDGVHPNGKCYGIMAEVLKEKVDIL